MKTTTISTTTGPRDVDVHAEAMGLAVTTCVDGSHCWNVTHLASGRAVARDLTTLEHAEAVMLELSMVGCWWLSMDEIRSDADFVARIRETLARVVLQ
jgi:hypothetical protein